MKVKAAEVVPTDQYGLGFPRKMESPPEQVLVALEITDPAKRQQQMDLHLDPPMTSKLKQLNAMLGLARLLPQTSVCG